MATAPTRQSTGTPLKTLNFAFPFRKAPPGPGRVSEAFRDQHEFLRLLRKEPDGPYAVSKKGLWHGGIHISDAGAGTSLDLRHGVRCMADGEVVAWRVNQHYPKAEIPQGPSHPPFTAQYSTGFALVRHRMEFPKDCMLTFYSLYMHLQDLVDYEADKALRRPAYWSTWFKVGPKTNDRQDRRVGQTAAAAPQIGLRVRATKAGGTVLGILPRGAHFSLLQRDGDWGQIDEVHELAIAAPAVGGYVAPGAAHKGWVYLGRVSGSAIVEPFVPASAVDRVVVPSKPIPIRAGGLIGHLGRNDWLAERAVARMVHLEMFCDDSIQAFIETGRGWIREHAAKPATWQQFGLRPEPTILRIDRQTKLFMAPDQEGRDPPISDVIQVYTIEELARRQVKPCVEKEAGCDGKSLRWWKVDSADVRRRDISGWVREENFPGGRISREFAQKWVDFAFLHAKHDRTHTDFATPQAYLDYITGAEVPEAGAIDKLSPLMRELCRQLYVTGDGAHAASQLCRASEDPWAAAIASRLIVQHESEWANPGKWSALIVEIQKKGGDAAALKAEHRKIQALTWWEEVSARLPALPAPEVFHLHPIGVIGNFIRHRRIDIEKFVALYKEAHPSKFGWYPEKGAAKQTLPALSRTSEDNLMTLMGWLDELYISKGSTFNIHYVAYMLATARLESYEFLTATFFGPVREELSYDAAEMKYGSGPGASNPKRAKALGNTKVGDGHKYRGRGLVQITWQANYAKFCEVAEIDLLAEPDAALEWRRAVLIMVEGMIRGTFTGKSLPHYINNAGVDYVAARRIINGTDKDTVIAEYATKFESLLRQCL
jgi:hypothetical protein